jgi:phage virion morphogenesis protein
MSGTSTGAFKGDWGRLEKTLLDIANADFSAAHREIGEALLRSTNQRFRDERAPDGKKWYPVAPKTAKRKGAHDKILTLTARLRRSISYRADADGVIIGTAAVYAATHQFGRRTGARSGSFSIPPRPFLGVSRADEAEIHKIYDDRMGGLIK